MPVIQLYLDEHADMHYNFRLSRTAMNSLIQLMQTGPWLEAPWRFGCLCLAGSVTANVFAKSTVCLRLHKITSKIKKMVREGKVIRYPQRDQLDNNGQGFARLAQHDAFSKAVRFHHIRIKPPNTHKEDF